MQLTFVNQTNRHLSLHVSSRKSAGRSTFEAPAYTSVTSSLSGFSNRTLRLETSSSREDEKANEPYTDLEEEPSISVPLSLGDNYKTIHVQEDSPWRIYSSRISRRHYQLTVIPRRDMASFLSSMPDTLPLSSLVLPGTHDTMAFYGWPISQCQSPNTPLDVQLRSGIRVLDVRLAVVDNRLIAYHGIFPQRTPFQEILSTIHAFLTAPATSREALVVSIKQEDFARTPLPLFSRLVHDEMENGPGGFGMWFLQNRIPTLGEVRGRVVLLSRFGGDGSGWDGGLEGLGIHPTAWPDSEKDGFTWTLKGTLVRMHDWYNIPSFLSIPEKTELATQILVMPPQSPPYPVLNITFLSAASFPLAFPPTIAKGFGWPKWGFGIEGVNGRVSQWLLKQLSGGGSTGEGKTKNRGGQGLADGEDVRIRGWVFVDYCAEPEDAELIPLLVECNYRGRRRGEEGWE